MWFEEFQDGGHLGHLNRWTLAILTFHKPQCLPSCLSSIIKKHVIKYCDKVFERSGRNLFWSIKNSNEVLNKVVAVMVSKS